MPSHQKRTNFFTSHNPFQVIPQNSCFIFYYFTGVSPYQDIHLAGEGQDKNSVKRSDQVFLVGEGGGEEAVEGDAAGVGGEHGEQAEDPNPHPQSLLLILGLKQILCLLLVVVA